MKYPLYIGSYSYIQLEVHMSTQLTPLQQNTVDEFIDKIPKNMRQHMTINARNELVAMLANDEVGDVYEEGIKVNTDLLTKYSASPERYMRAVKFVSYLNIGKKQFEAFALSHPEKYLEFKGQAEAEGWDRTKLRNKLSLKGANFKNTRIVSELIARSTVPLGIRYLHHKEAAVEKLAYLVEEAGSERVQMESADRLLAHLGIDMNDFKPNKEEDFNGGSIVSTLAGVLDKMVSMHQKEKEVNPKRSNAEILDGIVLNATRGES